MHQISQIRLNLGVEETNISFGLIDVKTTLNGLTNWIQINHELFIEFIKTVDLALNDYLKARDFANDEEIIKELESLGYDIESGITRYLNVYCPEHLFEMWPKFDPNQYLNGYGDVLDSYEDEEEDNWV